MVRLKSVLTKKMTYNEACLSVIYLLLRIIVILRKNPKINPGLITVQRKFY